MRSLVSSRLSSASPGGRSLSIAYGINKDGGHGRGKVKDEGDREAERKLRRLGDDYPDLFHMTRLGDTHAKILVCDSRFSIATSYNWLRSGAMSSSSSATSVATTSDLASMWTNSLRATARASMPTVASDAHREVRYPSDADADSNRSRRPPAGRRGT